MLGDLSPLERGRLQQFKAYNAMTMPIEERSEVLRAGAENIGMQPVRHALSGAGIGAASAAGTATLGLLMAPGSEQIVWDVITKRTLKPQARAMGRVVGSIGAAKGLAGNVLEQLDDPKVGRTLSEAVTLAQGGINDAAQTLRMSPDLISDELDIRFFADSPHTKMDFFAGIEEGLRGELDSPYGDDRIGRLMKGGDPLVDTIQLASTRRKNLRPGLKAIQFVRRHKLPILLGAAGLGGLLGGISNLKSLFSLQKMDDEGLQQHLLQSDLNRATPRRPGLGNLAYPLLSISAG